MKKAIEKLKKILIGILIFIFSCFAICMTVLLLNFNEYGVTEFGDKSLVILTREISSQNYKKGDLVIVEKVAYEAIKEGDEIFAYSVDSREKVNIEVGIVKDLYPTEKSIAYKNGAGFSQEYIIGKATDTYHDIGLYLSFIESKWGFLFIVLVPCFIIFIYEIYALVVEIRYGDEEDEEAPKKEEKPKVEETPKEEIKEEPVKEEAPKEEKIEAEEAPKEEKFKIE